MPLTTLRDFKIRMETLPGVDLSGPAQNVVLLADVHENGTLRALTDDSDIQQLVARYAPKTMVEVEVRELFPKVGVQNPKFVAVPLKRSDMLAVVRPTSAPNGHGRVRGGQGRAGNGALRTARQIVQMRGPPGQAPWSGSQPSTAPWSARDQTIAPPPHPIQHSTALAVSGPSPPNKASPWSGTSDASPRENACQLAEIKWPMSNPPSSPGSPTYDGRPGGYADTAWEGKQGDLSTHIMEAIGLREEYEHLQREARQRRDALEWLLRARDSVPGAYSLHLRPKNESAPGGGAKIFQTRDSSLASTSSGPQDCKGEYWPIKNRDVPKLCDAIASLAELEGTAIVRLRDQEVCATWTLSGAKHKMADERWDMLGKPQLDPRRIMCESRWLKFGEFSNVAFRIFPSGDATAQPGSTTVFVWMKNPPGINFTFNIRIGNTLSTAPRLWQATMTHYRLDMRWSRIEVLLGALANALDPLEITLQVLQWHGSEEEPSSTRVENHTNVSLALEMLNAAANPHAAPRPPLWPSFALNTS